MKRFKPYKCRTHWRTLMLFYYIPNLKIIDIEVVGEEVVYTFETNEEIVKGIELINVRHYKKLRTEEEIAVAEQLLQDAIADYERRRHG